MSDVGKFLDNLKNYDKDNVHENCRREVQVYLNDPAFKPELVANQSKAAAGLCSWVCGFVICI
jgi:dynein heavy chain